MASKAELERRLMKLDANMPELKIRYPDPTVFMSAFAGYADHITDEASPTDADWAFDQVYLLLAKHGYNPHDIY